MQDGEYTRVIEEIQGARDYPAKADRFERFREALAELDLELPEGGRGVILIAGTNGKGTVAKTLETVLAAGGESVGLFTSPHMMDTTERIRSHGRDLSRAEFVEVFERVREIVRRNQLSHFEILTLMMGEAFFGGRVRAKPERVVIEVGVGGRLDPTRAFPHATSVITTLGLDHQELLGETLAQIAREKFAIVDAGNLVVHAPFVDEAVAREAGLAARSVASRWVEAPAYPWRVLGAGDGDPVWILETPWGDARLALPGERTVRNVSLALRVLYEEGFDVARTLASVGDAAWPCRMEKFTIDGRRVYLSGDHNPQGVESLSEILGRFAYRTLRLVVGIGKNKDRAGMLDAFARLPRAEIYLTTTPFRAAPLESYGETWLARAAGAATDPLEALRLAVKDSAGDDLIVVSGSLYMVGDLRRRLIDERSRSHGFAEA